MTSTTEQDPYDAVARRIDAEFQYLDPEFGGLTYEELGEDYRESLRVAIGIVVEMINTDPEIRRGLGVVNG